jgi:aspartyl-tRNA(Asn)/glutamyl-tRNA(Gln) amidotransferase subunit C
MALSAEEVDKISKLAKLEFNDSEKQKFREDLSAILDYAGQLNDLSDKTVNIAAEDPDGVNLMRDDVAEPMPNPSLYLKQAPAKEGDYLKVKSILE